MFLSKSQQPIVRSRRPPYALIVSHVCRRWRDISLGTETLWSTISGGIYKPAGQLYMAMCLARCGSSPLDLCLDLGIARGATRGPVIPSLTPLRPHLPRLKSLALTSVAPEAITTLLAVLLGPSSSLVNLTLQSPAPASSNNRHGKRPSLRPPLALSSIVTLTLQNTLLPFQSPIHLPQLRRLTIDTTTTVGPSLIFELSPLLRGCPKLEFLQIGGPLAQDSWANNTYDPPSRSILVPTLQVLKLKSMIWWDLVAVLNSISFTQLETLHITDVMEDAFTRLSCHDQDSRIYRAICAFVGQVGGGSSSGRRPHLPSLRVLCLENFTNCAVQTTQLISILDLAPQLEELWLTSFVLEEDVQL